MERQKTYVANCEFITQFFQICNPKASNISICNAKTTYKSKENTIFVTQNNQGGTMHYTLKDH